MGCDWKAKGRRKGARDWWLSCYAYELDYEKCMEDYEVRQAVAIIKDRVNEITGQAGWKEKMVDEWK